MASKILRHLRFLGNLCTLGLILCHLCVCVCVSVSVCELWMCGDPVLDVINLITLYCFTASKAVFYGTVPVIIMVRVHTCVSEIGTWETHPLICSLTLLCIL
jgi:hypothetical protein